MNKFNLSDALILAPTFHKYERYCDSLIELIDRNWPEHPEIYFLSDNSSDVNIQYDKILRSERSEWPFVVLNGCYEIKNRFPMLKTILLLNEEAFPLARIDSVKICKIFQIALSHSLSYVYFPCYNHNWNLSTNIDNKMFCITPKDYKYYTQLGPAFWNIDHLIRTCEYAISNNILNPWKFETIVTDADHLISDYNWPTVADGLFKDGYVNLVALNKLPNDSKLKRQLKFDYIMSRPKRLWRFILRKTIGAINKILTYFNKKNLVYPYRS